MRIRQSAKLTGISISNSDGGDFSCILNGSLEDSMGNIESLDSLKISESENNRYENLSKSHVKNSSVFVMCAKTDDITWQCKKEVVLGQILCQHHLLKIRNNPISQEKFCKTENLFVNVAKKKRVATASDPGFYYYSGFEPSWAKQRGIKAGPNGKRMEVDDEEKYDYIDDYDISDDDDKMGVECLDFGVF